LRARKNIRVVATADVIENNWFYFEGDIINDETGLVQSFAMPLEFYFGVEGGEAWSEGSRGGEMYMSSMPAGRYTMRIEATWGAWQKPANLSVVVEQGQPRELYPLVILVLLAIIPLIVLLKRYNFEVRRWKESPFNPYQVSHSSE
jgi:hypothetical protein